MTTHDEVHVLQLSNGPGRDEVKIEYLPLVRYVGLLASINYSYKQIIQPIYLQPKILHPPPIGKMSKCQNVNMTTTTTVLQFIVIDKKCNLLHKVESRWAKSKTLPLKSKYYHRNIQKIIIFQIHKTVMICDKNRVMIFLLLKKICNYVIKCTKIYHIISLFELKF